MSILVTICHECGRLEHGEQTMCSCGNLDLEHAELAEV